jgi:hypothetical protein
VSSIALGATAAADTASENGVTHELQASARPDAVVADASKRGGRTGIALTIAFAVSTGDGGLPPPLSGARIEIDDDIRFDSTGIDRCARSEIEGRDSEGALAACAAAQVGQGTATAGCEAGGAVSERTLVLAVFNAAGKGQLPRVLVHAGSSAPADGLPAVFGARLTQGHALALPGRFAGGNCALRSLEVTLEKHTRYTRERARGPRDYVSAQCPAGRWTLQGRFQYEPNAYGVDLLEPRETIRCSGKKGFANP